MTVLFAAPPRAANRRAMGKKALQVPRSVTEPGFGASFATVHVRAFEVTRSVAEGHDNVILRRRCSYAVMRKYPYAMFRHAPT
jgi:hypothetical protein